MVADVLGLAYFAPVLAFLLVTLIIAALLTKLEVIGKNPWLNVFVALLVASVFVAASSVRQYVLTIIPWMGVLLISLFFILLILGFVGKQTEFLHKGIGVVFVVLVVIVFLVAGIVVFSNVIGPYLPGNSGTGGGASVTRFTDWLYSAPVMGGILLILVSALASWMLVRGSKEKKK